MSQTSLIWADRWGLPAPQRWGWLGLLAGVTIWGWQGTAIAVTQPIDLPEVSTAISIAPVPSPHIIDDPTQFLPVPSERISLLVLDLSERQLYGYQGDLQVVTYPVAVGRADWETPTGEFAVLQRQQHPTWQHPFTGELVPPGPDNPLGDRWIGFWANDQHAIGFHGTPDEHLIGQAVSHGCVRMRNADIVELYDRIRLGTRVIVQP